MRAFRLAVAVTIAVGLAACGSGEEPSMPDVAGKRLDVAQSDIERAGFSDDVDVVGGGLFGIVDEGNWEVCEQTPAPGEPLTAAPRLVVERDCNKDEAEPSEEPSEKPSDEPSQEPEETVAASPPAEPTMTVENSPELAALLAVTDYCDATVAAFANKYDDRTIEFDGSIALVARHGDAQTRFDFLIAPGDRGPNETRGPAFKFEDVNYLDLKLIGAEDRDSVREGDLVRVVAQVDEYNPTQCLFFLDPVTTTFR